MTFEPREGGVFGEPGRYDLKKKLGSGGMGEVWLAQDRRKLGANVALKFVRKELQDNEFIKGRFLRECLIGEKLGRWDGFVRVTEFDASDPIWCVMDYIDGAQTLKQLLETRASVTLVLSQLQSVAKALQKAHDQNCIHRDVKPSNILVDGSGQVFLADFGIGKDLGWDGRNDIPGIARDSHLTRTGQGDFGTPGYASPEQLVDLNDAGKPADVYGLCATLYAVISGTPPRLGRRKNLDAYTDWPDTLRNSCLQGLGDVEDRPELSVIRNALSDAISRVDPHLQIEPKPQEVTSHIRHPIDFSRFNVASIPISVRDSEVAESEYGGIRLFFIYALTQAIEESPDAFGFEADPDQKSRYHHSKEPTRGSEDAWSWATHWTNKILAGESGVDLFGTTELRLLAVAAGAKPLGPKAELWLRVLGIAALQAPDTLSTALFYGLDSEAFRRWIRRNDFEGEVGTQNIDISTKLEVFLRDPEVPWNFMRALRSKDLRSMLRKWQLPVSGDHEMLQDRVVLKLIDHVAIAGPPSEGRVGAIDLPLSQPEILDKDLGEEARRKEKEERERKAKKKKEQEAQRKAKEERERKATAEARRKAKEDRERKATAEARRKAKKPKKPKKKLEAVRKKEEKARRTEIKPATPKSVRRRPASSSSPNPEMQKLGLQQLVALGNRKAKRELMRRGRDPGTGKKVPPMSERQLVRRKSDSAKGKKKTPLRKQPVAQPNRDLGKKYTCFKCGTKFYQLDQPTPLCPGCGADQRDDWH